MSGNRRIDRVLGEGFLDELTSIPLAELRQRRDDALQEESDQSYLRRLLQGRIDIITAELRRRSGDGGSIIDSLPGILAEEERAEPRGSGRYLRTEPSRVESHRRRLEALVADVDLSDITGRSDEDLRDALDLFRREERSVSDLRRSVQQAADACAAEIARRYREGEADVASLLAAEPGES